MPSLNSISIIIPTFNRADLLAKVLRGYLEQSATDFIGELLVVDDGSSDPTQSVVDEIARRAPFPLRYIRQEHNGPAAARNLGIEKAQSDLILFTDSDIIPRLDLVEQHLEWHKQHPEFDTAMLGYVSWCPEMNPTPFMQWYGERGNLFCYGQLNAGQQVNHFFFYTCNLSLKTGFLRRYGRFDEEFRSAAFEDTELGFRLSKHGLRILYNPAAIGYHHQFFSFQAAVQKERGKIPASQLFCQKEAGRAMAREHARRRTHIGYRILRRTARIVACVLAPARFLLDSSVPLPSFLYKLFLWHSVEHGQFARRKLNSRILRSLNTEPNTVCQKGK